MVAETIELINSNVYPIWIVTKVEIDVDDFVEQGGLAEEHPSFEDALFINENEAYEYAARYAFREIGQRGGDPLGRDVNLSRCLERMFFAIIKGEFENVVRTYNEYLEDISHIEVREYTGPGPYNFTNIDDMKFYDEDRRKWTKFGKLFKEMDLI
jgi:hypothetical protein